MKTTAMSFAVLVALGGFAHATDNSNENGSKADPKSSVAATPDSVKPSPGTVGAGKDAEGGSFTASKADQSKDLTKAK